MKVIYTKNKSEDLTIEEAKTFECCEGLTDAEIKELLETLRVFTEIVYSIFSKTKENEIETEEEAKNFCFLKEFTITKKLGSVELQK